MMGTARKIAASRPTLAASEWWKRQRRPASSPSSAAGTVLCDGPAVTEAGVVVDLVKTGIDISELLADAFDESADVGAIAVRAAAGEEILPVHEVVELAVGDILAGLQGELGDHVEFGERKVDRLAAPEG